MAGSPVALAGARILFLRCSGRGRQEFAGVDRPIASAQQKMLAETLPNGRIELFAGYGHGVNLLQPERCARTAVEFWRSIV